VVLIIIKVKTGLSTKLNMSGLFSC